MIARLLTPYTALECMEHNAAIATLTCHANAGRDFTAPNVLSNIIKLGHESILEHITLTYSIKFLSRACLQELARHRHISLSVESTRHTLHKIIRNDSVKNEYRSNISPEFYDEFDRFVEFARKNQDMPNDKLKYRLPEFWPTNLILTANIRSLRHIITLRTAPQALKEFQRLARALYNVVPDGFQYLLADCLYKAPKSADSPDDTEIHDEIDDERTKELTPKGLLDRMSPIWLFETPPKPKQSTATAKLIAGHGQSAAEQPKPAPIPAQPTETGVSELLPDAAHDDNTTTLSLSERRQRMRTAAPKLYEQLVELAVAVDTVISAYNARKTNPDTDSDTRLENAIAAADSEMDKAWLLASWIGKPSLPCARRTELFSVSILPGVPCLSPARVG